jgi:hypothetical protein
MENNSKQSKQCKTKTEPKHNIRKQQKTRAPSTKKTTNCRIFMIYSFAPTNAEEP